MNDVMINELAKDYGHKWVYAIDEGDGWVALMASKERVGLNETAAFDNISMGRIQQSKIASFRIGARWDNRRPNYMIDYRDHSNTPIAPIVGMMTINQAHAGLF